MQKTSIWYLACLKLRDSSTCFYKSLKKQLRNFHLLHREQHWGPSKGVSIAKWASAKGRRSHVVVSESASLRHNACVTGHSQAQDLGKKEHKILTLREAIPGEAQPFAWSRSWGLLGTHRTEEAQRAAKESWETSKLLLFCSLSDSRLGIWQGPEMPPAPAPCSSPFSTWAQPAQSLCGTQSWGEVKPVAEGRSHWRQRPLQNSLTLTPYENHFSKTLSPMLKRTAQPVPPTIHPLLWSPHSWI